MTKTPEERAITRTKEFFAPRISHWPDKRVKDLKTYRQFLLQECWADFRNAVYEDLRIPQFVRWLQKVLERGAEWWKRTKAK